MKKLLFLTAIILSTSVQLQAQKPLHADSILNKAKQQAAKENKNIFIIFTASWCGWCKKMDTSLNDPSIKKYFTDSYVIEHLTVQESDKNKHLENPGAQAYLEKVEGGKEGLPYWVILDKNGNLLEDSRMIMPDNTLQNVGCPASEAEVKHFIKVIYNTTTIDEEGREKIGKRFRKNE